MTASDAVSSLFGDADRFHESAKKGLWVGLLTALIGLILILLSGVIVVTSSVSPSIGNGDSPALAWLFSKLVGLLATALVILPVVYTTKWVSNRLGRRSKYAFSYLDPFLAIGLFSIGAITLWYAATVFQSLDLDGVQTVLGVLLVGGVYLIFAGIGTEVAMAWIFSFTTFALFVKHLHFRAIARRVFGVFSFLWGWTKYPRLWYRYSVATDRTFAGSLYALLIEARRGISNEIATVHTTTENSQSERVRWVQKHAGMILLVISITVVFGLQVRIAGEQATPRAVAEWIFLNEETIGWTLSPFLHRGFQHYIQNIILISFAGYFIEKHLNTRIFVTFLVAIGYVSIGADAAYKLAVSGGPIMVIGSSGMTMAILTYTGVHLALLHDLLPEIDEFLPGMVSYLEMLRLAPLDTVSYSLQFFAMVTGLIYPLVQIFNDWTGAISPNSEVAGIVHLVGAVCGLLLAIGHTRYTSFGLEDQCLVESEGI